MLKTSCECQSKTCDIIINVSNVDYIFLCDSGFQVVAISNECKHGPEISDILLKPSKAGLSYTMYREYPEALQ